MRKLYLNQAALSAKATTVIRDADNESRYLLVGKWGLRADVLSVYTISGALEAEVKQETLGLLPKFRLLYHRQMVGRVSKTLGVIREVLFVRGLAKPIWAPHALPTGGVTPFIDESKKSNLEDHSQD